MNANQKVEQTIAQQASEWVTVLRSKPTPAELAAFAEWIKTSPRHIRDFLIMTTIEKELHGADSAHKYGIHELTHHELSNILPLQTPALDAQQHERKAKSPAPALRIWRNRPALAAALAVLAVGALAIWRPAALGGWQTYSTGIGEQRAVELQDGSIAHLNTRSKIKVRITNRARDIRLLDGEALFKVHRDPERTFRVYTENAAIQALGTQFNVYRRQQETTVAVIEGKVRVSPSNDRNAHSQNTAPAEHRSSPTPLGAGEEAHISMRGEITKNTSADVSSAVAWRLRRLVFQAASLAEIVEEFNRYNAAPKFKLMDRKAEQRHYTGMFDADDPESLVELLLAEPDLSVTKTENEIVVSTKPQ